MSRDDRVLARLTKCRQMLQGLRREVEGMGQIPLVQQLHLIHRITDITSELQRAMLEPNDEEVHE